MTTDIDADDDLQFMNLNSFPINSTHTIRTYIDSIIGWNDSNVDKVLFAVEKSERKWRPRGGFKISIGDKTFLFLYKMTEDCIWEPNFLFIKGLRYKSVLRTYLYMLTQ
jgi:hypothetical protein